MRCVCGRHIGEFIMTLEMLKEIYAVCKLKQKDDVDFGGQFTSLTISEHEISLVCEQSRIPNECIAEKGYKAFRIAGTLEFSMVGVLSRLSKILADENISIIAVSTYDTDYILVKQEAFAQAKKSLSAHGYKIKKY